nr:MAG TPA: hypothetical protein [Caudoviricetes sp.]
MLYVLYKIYNRIKSIGLLSTLNSCQFSFNFKCSDFKNSSI